MSAKKSSAIKYIWGGKTASLSLKKMAKKTSGVSSRRVSSPREGHSSLDMMSELLKQHSRLSKDFPRFHELDSTGVFSVSSNPYETVLATESVIVEVKKAKELKWLRDKFGMELVQEGRFGKMLMRVPESGERGVRMAFSASLEAYKRKDIGFAHPNFLRVSQKPKSSSGKSVHFWNINNSGSPGVVGADSHALAAWTITTGSKDIRVAVLDEGVDTRHPYLKEAVVDEADFVDNNTHSRPDGDDAHGTACAGIICSRNNKYKGLAPDVSLVGVRIAKSDSFGNWIFDDFDTADAIDWSWSEAEVDVLSNSWGGGPPTDVITREFERASTQGRGGLGSVVVVASGNEQRSSVGFPANLPNVLAVGASNQWDKRKTRSSQDGEDWWGSNYGDELDLMAPGVKISTTDITGHRGYSNSLTTPNFNGTSSACPHVAAAAALVLSIRPDLEEQVVRDLLTSTADSLSGSDKWNKHTGHGRLNTYRALWEARRI